MLSRRKIFLSVTAGILLLYGGCKNDIDLLADYKPVLLCYGILNPYDSIQYVRISKVFLGEGNALVMAQQPDSSGLAYGTADVRIEKWYNGQFVQSYTLSPDTTIPRDSGTFSYPYQVIYRGTFPVAKDGSTYKISVTDLSKGTNVTSETKIVQDVVMVDPPGNSNPLNLHDTTFITFRFKSGKNALRYDFYLRFHYTEQFINDTTESSERYFDWHIGQLDTRNGDGGEPDQFSVKRHSFIYAAAANIPYKPYVRRIAGKVDLVFTGANQDLVTFIDVQSAISGSATDIPPFSNINGGYGVFAGRTTTYLPGYSLDANTHYALRNDPVTQQLNFIR